LEKGWERSSPLIDLEGPVFERVVARAFAGAQLVSAERLSGGLANTNYRLLTSAGPEHVVLRVYTRDPGACAREAAILEAVEGVAPAPRVIYQDAGRTVCPYPYLVETWLAGVRLQDMLEDDALRVRLGAPLGRMAAQIGTIRFETPGFFGPGLPLRPSGPLPDLPSYVHACLDSSEAKEGLGEGLAAELQALVTANEAYMAFDGAARLVHGDYKPSNLLVDVDQRSVSGVLDWEFAFAGPPLYDLATLLRDSDASPPAYEVAVCAGFVAGGGELPADWKRRVRLLDFANLCGFLAQPGEAAQRTSDVRRLLLATLRQWPDLPA
jgi:aminoglycoside phosphotransferase (APT) family kinase protein